MYWPYCQLIDPFLHLPNRFGWSRPMKPPRPVPWPIDAPKFTLPVRFSFTLKMMSTSPWSLAWPRLRQRQRRLEEPEVLDAPVAVDQRVLVEHVAGNDRELVADAGLGRVVVADDLDAIDDRRACPPGLPSEDSTRGPESVCMLVDDRANLRIDVALVRVRVLELARGVVPLASRRTRPSGADLPLTSDARRCVERRALRRRTDRSARCPAA